jgi:hypothetical protein
MGDSYNGGFFGGGGGGSYGIKLIIILPLEKHGRMSVRNSLKKKIES